ncbi:MAG TPA: hypothetical protein VKT80_20025, partial [Chloroflexota bacterium]|nr:hypothetical protein [Chloroflexota bacterium]
TTPSLCIASRWPTMGILAGTVSLTILVALASGPLYNVWRGRYVKSTYNTHVKDTAALIRPNDAVILDGTSQSPLYSYYVNYPWMTYPLPRDVPLDVDQTTRELRDIAANHVGAWIFLYATTDYDPGYVVPRWLTQHAYRAFDDWAVTGRLQYYRFDTPANLVENPVSITFGNGLSMTQYAFDGHDLAAGDTVPTAFWWKRPTTGGPRMRISLRLVDQSGFTWAQSDQELGGDFFDEGDWPGGSPLEDHHGLLVPPGTPPGAYRVRLNVYQADNGEPVLATGTGLSFEAGGIGLGDVRVVRAADHVWTDGIAGYHSSDAIIGGVKLLGYSGSSRAVAGDSGYLTLVWTALVDHPKWTSLQVEAIAESGQIAQTRELPLATDSYPV